MIELPEYSPEDWKLVLKGALILARDPALAWGELDVDYSNITTSGELAERMKIENTKLSID